MKLKLISPAPRNKYCNKKGKTSFPQLNLRILESLTPDDFFTEICDERIEDLDLGDSPDLVGITVMTPVALRAYEIADSYRARGIPVVLGGIHPSLMPDEALMHADSVITGEAERAWGQLITDFREGRLKKIYSGEKLPAFEDAYPRLYPVKNPGAYSIPHTIQTTRGCPFDCMFCSVTHFWGKKYRFRPVEDVIDEIKGLRSKKIAIIDDNVIGNPKYAKKLFEKMIPLNVRWIGQASITLARDEHLLSLLKRSGCDWLFIGIESLTPENLEEMNKKINKVETMEENIGKIKRAGINVIGSFIFGFDHDDSAVFDGVVDFCIRTKLDAANLYILTPFPGTSLFEKMDKEGRMLTKNWDLYDANHVVFQPKKMEPMELLEGYIEAYKKMYSLGSIFRRVNGLSRRTIEMLSLNLMRMKNKGRFGKWSRQRSLQGQFRSEK